MLNVFILEKSILRTCIRLPIKREASDVYIHIYYVCVCVFVCMPYKHITAPLVR